MYLLITYSDVTDESGEQFGLPRTGPFVLHPHEIDADQTRLPFQIIRIPG